MCSGHGEVGPSAPVRVVKDAPFRGEVIPLEPVDSVVVTPSATTRSTSSSWTRAPNTGCSGARAPGAEGRGAT